MYLITRIYLGDFASKMIRFVFSNSGNGPTTNGYSGQNAPSSSGQLSADGGGSGGGQEGGQQTLISRTQKQHTTQQVKTFENPDLKVKWKAS